MEKSEKGIRQQEEELFSSMAKVKQQPLANDVPIDPHTLSAEQYRQWAAVAPFDEVLAHAEAIDWYRTDFEFAKRTWPSMTDEQAHHYSMGYVP